jgi:4-oxalomesaconate tautomerase
MMEVFLDLGEDGSIKGAGTVRTARKLFDGLVFPG